MWPDSPGGSADEASIDPICHTLVGATLARSGLSRRTALGTATLLIGANLPDIDILAYFGGPAADLSFRRGWTHGIPALVVLPFLLTAGIVGFDQLVRRMGRATLPSGVVPAQVLLLGAAAILTHPILDSLNTYGVRWLMPFSGRWFYGDTLYIVDPWLWLILGIGFFLSGYRHRTRRLSEWTARPASVALAVSTGYVVVMALAGMLARRITAKELTISTGEKVEALMVAPAPFTPFVRSVVAAQGNSYRTGEFRWFRRPHLVAASMKSYPRGGPQGPAVNAAAATPLGRRFLAWARFPVFQVESGPNGSALVHMIDLRYTTRSGKGFGTVTVPVEVPATSGSSSDSLSAFPAAWPAGRSH